MNDKKKYRTFFLSGKAFSYKLEICSNSKVLINTHVQNDQFGGYSPMRYWQIHSFYQIFLSMNFSPQTFLSIK